MDEFSSAAYQRVLEGLLRSHYRPLVFRQLRQDQPRGGRTCLLRHDVDVCMDYALDMARLEHALGVRATYFVMLRSPMYNLMTAHNLRVLRELTQLQHEVGLHFDANDLHPDETALDRLQIDVAALDRLLPQPISAFSFHQPTAEIIAERLESAGLINTYHPGHLQGYQYFSDSNRIWRNINPFDVAASGHDHVHLLTHPVWWFAGGSGTEDCWDAAIRVNFDRTQRQLLARERAYGPPRKMQLRRLR